MKVSVIGAGNVGASCVQALCAREVCKKVVLLDIREGLAEGKALDVWQSAPILHHDTHSLGITQNYDSTADSNVVVITSGVPRKPGMSRDDLINVNAKIVEEVTIEVCARSPNAILVIVSNPLDVMTFQALRVSGWKRHRVMGMAGVLDTARYRAFLAEALHVSPKDIQAMLLGGHGDTMVPLPRYTTVSGIPVDELLPEETINKIISRTQTGGGEIVKLLGTSAWYAPGAAAAQMVEAILKDQRRVVPVCTELKGEYGIKKCPIGVPVVLGQRGVEKILELKLTDEEKKRLNASAEHVQATIQVLKSKKRFAN